MYASIPICMLLLFKNLVENILVIINGQLVVHVFHRSEGTYELNISTEIWAPYIQILNWWSFIKKAKKFLKYFHLFKQFLCPVFSLSDNITGLFSSFKSSNDLKTCFKYCICCLTMPFNSLNISPSHTILHW